jgi:hypothetical protein
VWRLHGRPRVIAAATNLLAVGTASGMVLLLAHASAAAAALPADNATSAAAALESIQSAADPVTALAFSHSPGASDPLWLAVGHSSGARARARSLAGRSAGAWRDSGRRCRRRFASDPQPSAAAAAAPQPC